MGLLTEQVAVFFVGLAVSGWGFGTLFVAAFGGVAGLARPDERAELAAALFSVSYLAFGGSAVLAGLAVPSYGLRPTAAVYAAIVIALSALAAVLGRRRTDAAPEVAEPAAVPEVALRAAPPVRVHAGAVR